MSIHHRYWIFVDLDGVLADFEEGVHQHLQAAPSELAPARLWSSLSRIPDFYTHLPWMAEGKELWQHLKPLNPTILTGVPWGNWAKPQKYAWCKRELGPEVPVITCFSRQKAQEGRAHTPKGKIPLLIDDRSLLRTSWEQLPGVFLHHENTRTTLQNLHDIL